jgi:hypothetical protein
MLVAIDRGLVSQIETLSVLPKANKTVYCLRQKKRAAGAQQTERPVVFKVGDHLATSGFSDPQRAKLAHHHQGQSPKLKLVGSLLSGGYCQQTHGQNTRARAEA